MLFPSISLQLKGQLKEEWMNKSDLQALPPPLPHRISLLIKSAIFTPHCTLREWHVQKHLQKLSGSTVESGAF